MNMQQAMVIQGMLYRGRRIYLEQKGMNKEEVDKDEKAVKQDCLEFSLQVKKMTEGNRSPSGLFLPN